MWVFRAFLTVSLALMLTPTPAEAFRVNRTATGAELHWPSHRMPIQYRLHVTGSADVTDGSDLEAVARAFQSWQNVSCSSLTFQRGPDFTGTPTFSCSDNMNLVFWFEDNWPQDAGSHAIGVATTCFSRNSGEIVDSDIWFNGVNFRWATDGRRDRVDVQNIAAHEVGHFFGLGHSESTDATMYYASAGAGETAKRSLSDDDVAGICHIYPTGCANNADCAGDYVCVRNRCEPPPPDPSGLGEPCTVDHSCQAGLGTQDAMCLDEATYFFPAGYCTVLNCGASSPCPVSGECIGAFVDGDGNTVYTCFTPCNPASPSCRDGYVCLGLHDAESRGVCYPACRNDADCGGNYCDELTGYCVTHRNDTAGVGDPCTEHAHCPTGGGCLAEQISQDPSYVGPAGGYCTKDCGVGMPCPEGSSCYTLDGAEGPVALCLQDCRANRQGDCRGGYACWPAGQTDPNTGAPMGACWLACRDDSDCGTGGGLVCNSATGLCESSTVPSGGGDGQPPGGGQSGGGDDVYDPFADCEGCQGAGGSGLLALLFLVAFCLAGNRA